MNVTMTGFDYKVVFLLYLISCSAGSSVARVLVAFTDVSVSYAHEGVVVHFVQSCRPNPPSARSWRVLFRAPFMSRSILNSHSRHSNVLAKPRLAFQAPQSPHVLDVPDSMARSVTMTLPSRNAAF